MSCPEYRDLMSGHIEGTLSPAEHHQLLDHAEQCGECRADLAQARRDEALLQAVLAPATPAEDASRAVLARLTDEPAPCATGGLSASDRTGGQAASGTRLSANAPSGRMRLGRAWFKPLAMAAALALAVGIGFSAGRVRPAPQGSSVISTGGPIHIKALRGTVLAQHGTGGRWEVLGAGGNIDYGVQFLVAPQSEVRINLADNSSIQMGPNTQCALVRTEAGLEFRLDYGQADLDLISPHGPFAVRTPQGRIEALGTAFTVCVR